MELSRPVQVWLGFPPVQAEHSSLVTRVIPPMSGTGGLLELEEAGSSDSLWSWELQDRLFLSCKSPGLSECLGETNVNRTSGLPRPSTAVPRIPTGLSGRFVGDVEPSDGGGTDMIVGVLAWKADASITQQIASCVLELAESNYSVYSV